jgi:DNA-binding GntR family transcriptional regulator
MDDVISRERTSQAVARHLVRQLLSGRRPGGSRIDLEEVAKELGVSRLPVREALLQLEHDGVVVSRYHRAVFVADLSAGTVRDHFELYGQLSAFAAGAVARVAAPGDVEELEAAMSRVSAAVTGDDFEKHSQEYLRLLNLGAGSPRLVVLLRSFSTFVPESFHLLDLDAGQLAERKDGLAEVMEAIREKDPTRAHDAMLHNIRSAGEAVVAALARDGVIADGETRT